MRQETRVMRLASPAFRDGAPIPRQHTVDGADLSPPLGWSEAPSGTRSLILVMEDADAPSPAGPGKPFLHWFVYNLPPSVEGLDLGANSTGLPPPGRSGRNDFGSVGYIGPAPVSGEHRYVFRLLALDTTLQTTALGDGGRTRPYEAVARHVLATAELNGTYRRSAQ
jgi:Raf kinase inhibitor-like YbhB/YbcL family protein